VDVAVAADAENAFAHEPAGVAETIRLAGDTGLAGISVEDYDRDGNAIYDRMLAVDRVTAAVEAARAANLVLTARAESLLHGGTLAEAVTRVELFVGAGADVVFVPGVRAIDDIDAVVQAAGGTPVNVLVLPGCPTVAELAELGVARISVGGAFTWAAYAAVLEAAQELRDEGTYSYVDRFSKHRQAINDALR
jgi:2-methylisocitrate lyase-like PEP mutase family enzyme